MSVIVLPGSALLAVLALWTLVVAPWVSRQIAKEKLRRAQFHQCVSQLETLGAAYEAFRVENGKYPLNQDLLVGDYLAELPTCPDVGRMTYRTEVQSVPGSTSTVLIFCAGENHKPMAERNFPSYQCEPGL